MLRVLLVLALLVSISTSMVYATDDIEIERARAAIAIALARVKHANQPKPKMEVDPSLKPPIKTPMYPRYADVGDKAARDGTPLVLFIGVAARPIAGAISTYDDQPLLDGTPKSIVVGIPNGKGSLDRYDLPSTASDEQIRAILQQKQSRSSISPPLEIITNNSNSTGNC